MLNTLLFLVGQTIVYGLLFLLDDYVGTLLAALIGAIAFCVWGISHVTELIQQSKVSSTYYGFILSAWVAPLLALVGWVLLRGRLAWLG